ncbi:DUF1878 family protein [Cytobacillus praedii]|uniref:DUF1878 family protein n=1 Tax=Cytobacillus praedii TaxID=1742358 RepID=UPI000AFCCB6E|nr:DUF1878 family protein [Cytobacillus praedii]MED3551453.1 DUF1878 family protein [Cytobacillus praedii]
MDIYILMEKINKLEYHQKLLLKVIENPNHSFYKLVVEKSLAEKDVKVFNQICEELNIKWEEQKAEGFVYFHPLYKEFEKRLHPNLTAYEVIYACIKQQLFLPLMIELRRYL